MESMEPVMITEVPESPTGSHKKKRRKRRNAPSTSTSSTIVTTKHHTQSVAFSQDQSSRPSVYSEESDDRESKTYESVYSNGSISSNYFNNKDVSTNDNDSDEELSELSDSEYDTDLEMNCDKWLNPEKYDQDTTGISKYNRACEEHGVEPIRFVIKHIQDVNLSLRHHGLGLSAVRALSAPLETNTTIEQIDLEGNWIMTEGTYHLCQVLRENVYVTNLNLSENKIDSEGAKAVCKLLIGNMSIEYLNLAGNDIGNHSGESFYQLLTKNSMLKSLNLRHNKFEDVSAHFFKDAITENETLMYLDLSWNLFQSKGCIQLAEGLKENVGLTDFSVAMNGFGLEGGLKLGEAIQDNRKLLRLDASYCRLPKESAGTIAHGLHHNDYLVLLDISNNFIHDEGAFQILSAVDQNDSSNLKRLNLGSTIVHDDFKKLEDKLKEERSLEVLHGGVGYMYVKQKEIDPMDAFSRDPMTKLKEWVAQTGYRMIDLLKRFDKDGSMSISRDEFKQGIKTTSIPITDQQLEILVDRLDQDGDGEIDYKELMMGDNENRKTKRDIQKIIIDKKDRQQELLKKAVNKFVSGREDLIKKTI